MTTIQISTADTTGLAETGTTSDGITAIRRAGINGNELIIQKNNKDIFVAAVSPGFIPMLQGAYMSNSQMALVVDYDLKFEYQLYGMKNEQWVLLRKASFNNMTLARRQNLILVEVTDLTHVKLTYNIEKNHALRFARITNPDDYVVTFEFLPDGKILKNGIRYRHAVDGEWEAGKRVRYGHVITVPEEEEEIMFPNLDQVTEIIMAFKNSWIVRFQPDGSVKLNYGSPIAVANVPKGSVLFENVYRLLISNIGQTDEGEAVFVGFIVDGQKPGATGRLEDKSKIKKLMSELIDKAVPTDKARFEELLREHPLVPEEIKE